MASSPSLSRSFALPSLFAETHGTPGTVSHNRSLADPRGWLQLRSAQLGRMGRRLPTMLHKVGQRHTGHSSLFASAECGKSIPRMDGAPAPRSSTSARARARVRGRAILQDGTCVKADALPEGCAVCPVCVPYVPPQSRAWPSHEIDGPHPALPPSRNDLFHDDGRQTEGWRRTHPRPVPELDEEEAERIHRLFLQPCSGGWKELSRAQSGLGFVT
jgi:hypothetical protein